MFGLVLDANAFRCGLPFAVYTNFFGAFQALQRDE